MKRILSLNWKLYFLIAVVVFIGLGFYWFQIRPSEIRKICANEAATRYNDVRPVAYANNYRNNFYRLCLTKQGLKPESLFVNTATPE